MNANHQAKLQGPGVAAKQPGIKASLPAWEPRGRSVYEIGTLTPEGHRVRVCQVDKVQGSDGPRLAVLLAHAPALAYALEALLACSDASLPLWREHARALLSSIPLE